MKAGEVSFIPKNTANFNREPNRIGVDGKIYCYQDQYFPKGHIIMQLTNATTLKIEHQQCVCPQVPDFTHPFIFT